MKITRDQLLVLLAMQSRSTIVSLTAETRPEMRKRGNPHADAVKIAAVSGVLGCKYANAVNRRRDREGRPENADGSVEQFYSTRRAWGRRVDPSPLVEHRGRFYLDLQRQRILREEFRTPDGATVPRAKIEPFLRVRDEGRRQGLKRPVVLRDFSIDSIRQLRLHGQIYDVEQEEGVEGQRGKGTRVKKASRGRKSPDKPAAKGRPTKKPRGRKPPQRKAGDDVPF